MPDTTWNSAPGNALWYGLIVIERPDGETDYMDAYSAHTDVPSVDLLCPEGCTILERELRATPLGKDMLDGWADDEILPAE